MNQITVKHTTCAISGTGTAHPSGAPEFRFDFGGVRVTQCLAFCIALSLNDHQND
jgi:hypothetical protein